MQRKTVYIHPSVESLDPRSREVLEHLAPVSFASCADLSALSDGSVVLSLSCDDAALRALSSSGLNYFHSTQHAVGPRDEHQTRLLRFADSPLLDELLRNRAIAHREIQGLAAVETEVGDEVLAQYADRPVWVARPREHSIGHIVSGPLPRLAAGEHAFDYLNGYDFIQLMPVLHFLRQAAIDQRWTRPPIRACFIFDDPNLRWPTYGCLSYHKLADLAKEERFHVTVATVPLDAWGAHPGVARLFRQNVECLSLLMHGNNHTCDELGQSRGAREQSRLVSQGLQRIERLERATALHVDRVIVPPHEALIEEAAAAMLSLGVEGASLSAWSSRHWNASREWPATFGTEMADVLAGGFPLLGRYRLTQDCEGPAIISAFLGRPIILSEHHKAVAGGYELLSAAAAVVNGLGAVVWSGPEAMLRANYLSRVEGSSLWVAPYSCRMELRVPEGVSSVTLAGLGGYSRQFETGFRVIRRTPGTDIAEQHARLGEPFEACPGETITLASPVLGAAQGQAVPGPKLSLGALSRRVLCEVRDRLEGYMVPR